MGAKVKLVWSAKHIEAERLRVKSDFKSAPSPIKFGLEKITELKAVRSQQGKLECYLYIVSLLFHHVQKGGLQSWLIPRLISLGESLLIGAGIKKDNSRLGYLYADFNIIRSQLYQLQGKHREAMLEQRAALFISRNSLVDLSGFHHVNAGVLSMRSGHGSTALKLYEKAEEVELTDDLRQRLFLEKHKALRLVQGCEQAEAFESAHPTPPLTGNYLLEWEWEKLWRRAQQSGDITYLMRSVLAGRTHHKGIYLLEAFLTSRMVKTKDWLHRYRTLGPLYTKGAGPLKESGVIYHAAKCLVDCYNSKIPASMRFRQICSILAKGTKLFTIEQELMLWGATARWCYRSKMESLLSLAIEEYVSLSLKLTSGKCADTLGFVSDILTKYGYNQGQQTLPPEETKQLA